MLIFTVKMLVAIAPVIFDFDKKLVNAAIMQLELEGETKDAKDINKTFKTTCDLINSYDLAFSYSLVGEFSNYHYFSKKFLTLYFPPVPTPPPNFT